MADFLRSLAICAIALLWFGASSNPSIAGLQLPVNADAAAFDAFSKRVAEYSALQKKISATLPSLPGKPTPQQLDDYQRTLGQRLIHARKNARKGDVFGSDMPAVIRRLLAPVFKGAEGARVRAAIIDEPHPAVPAVNARYPDGVPLSTMPPDVLKVLPKLEEGLEFRFIDRHLILLDVKSHLIVDVIDNAMPA
jgi:hypothetical protein